jgi:hypothetical protein
MKSLIFGLLLFPTVLLAQVVTVQKPVECAEIKLVMTAIMKELKEVPVFVLTTDSKSKIALTANHQTKSWTLLEFNAEIACILSTGEDFDMKMINFVKRQHRPAL